MSELTFFNPMPAIEPVSVRPVNNPVIDPRCSLDFVIQDAQGHAIASNLIRIKQFHGQDQVSQPFSYQVSVVADDIGDDNMPGASSLDFEKLLGCSATVRIGLPCAENTPPAEIEYVPFNGIISEIAMAGAGNYQLTLQPSLWTLDLCNDYKIYPMKTIREIIHEIVVVKHGIQDACLNAVDGIADARSQDWLQAGESDLAFIHRLMEKVGVYYYFTHSFEDGVGSHRAIFGHRPHYEKTCGPNARPLCLYYTYSKQDSLGEDDLITDFNYQRKLTSRSVNTVLAQADAAWEYDSTAQSHEANESSSETANKTFRYYKQFDYGISEGEARHYGDGEAWKLASSSVDFSGTSSCYRLKPGHTFTCSQKKYPGRAQPVPRPDVANNRPQLDNIQFVLTSVSHQANINGNYQNQFQAKPATASLANFSNQGTHMGSVLARVVGHNQGSDPNSLHYLRKDNFAYDTKTFTNKLGGANASYTAKGVFVVFSTDGFGGEPVWVKLAKHMQTIPEIGVTVIVSRSGDDSEVPEVQQAIQAKGSKVVIPNRATDNTNVGDSYSTSYGDSHSVRYGKNSKVDLDQAVQRIEDEYTSKKFKEVSYSQGASYSYSTSEDGKNGLLSKSESHGCHDSKQYSKQVKSYSEVDTAYSTSIGDSYGIRYGNKSTRNTEAAYAMIDAEYKSGQFKDVSYSVGGSYSYSASDSGAAGLLSKSESHGSHDSKQYSAEMKSYSEIGTSNSTSHQGAANNVSTLGMSNSASATGMINSASAIGMSNNASAIGMSNSASAIGMNNTASAVGMSNTASAVGMENSASAVGMRNSISVVGSGTDIRTGGMVTVIDTTAAGLKAEQKAAVTESNIGFMAFKIMMLEANM